jgi:hypothetical protein
MNIFNANSDALGYLLCHLNAEAPVVAIALKVREGSIVASGACQQLAPLPNALYGGLLCLNNRIVITADATSGYASTADAKDGGKHP